MKAARLAALIKQRLGLEAKRVAGGIGEFRVLADGVPVAVRGGNWLTRSLGGGYPDFDAIIAALEKQ